MQLSIVVPLFNEEESLPELTAWIKKVTAANNIAQWELFFVDDGSTDNSWLVIEKLCTENNQVKGSFLCLSLKFIFLIICKIVSSSNLLLVIGIWHTDRKSSCKAASRDYHILIMHSHK